MKIKLVTICHLLCAICFSTSAQGTAFSYQGRLNDSGSPATGIYDVRFTIYDAVTNGNLVAGPLTNSATAVTNGLFVVPLDFGSGVFTGAARWLEVDVRTNGGGAFSTLLPLQPIQPVPYAIMANTASNLLGTLPIAQMSGTIPLAQLPGAVLTNNSSGVVLGGTFSGNGSGLTNIASATAGTATNALNVSEVNMTLPPYNVIPGGLVDNTYVITNGLALLTANGQKGYLPPGTYLTHPFVLYSGQSFHGGPARLLFPTNYYAPYGWAVALDYYSSNMTIGGFEIDGGNPNTIPTVDDGRVGLMLWNTHATGNSVGWIYAHGFGTGIALYANPSEDPRASELNLQDSILHYNYRGLQVQNGAEYITFTGIQSTENNWGLDDLAANNFFNSCDFSINNHGANLEVNGNSGHDAFQACYFNHETYDDVVATNVINGTTFTGCNFLPPNIYLTNCQGFSFIGGMMGWNVMLNNGLTNTVTFDHSTNCSIVQPMTPYYGVANNGYLVVQTGSKNISFQDGFNWYGNFIGNGSGLTNIPASAITGGFNTNILVGGHTFYITNGIIMNIQ